MKIRMENIKSGKLECECIKTDLNVDILCKNWFSI